MAKCRPYDVPQKKWVVVFKVNRKTRKLVYGDTEEEVLNKMQLVKEQWAKKYEQRALENVI